jgi:hypothetical protein
MKKALLLLLCLSLCLSSIFTLTSCNEDGDTTTTTTMQDPAKPTATPTGDPVTDSQGVKYRLYSDNTYHVVGTAETYSANIAIPETYENLSITVIEDYAFDGCRNLKSITIPSSKQISTGDWFGIDGNGNKNNSTFGSSVISIGKYAFRGCINLQSITIPSSVKHIGIGAFESCTSLYYHVYNNAKYLGNSENPYMVLTAAMNNDIISCNIHQDTKIIFGSSFSFCYNLQSITIPNHVTTIGDRAFSGCTRLQSITIPYSVTTIGNYAFKYCTNLQNITVPYSVTAIGYHAFEYCTNLQSIMFEDITTWYRSYYANGLETDVSDPAQNATYFKDTYSSYFWHKE